MAFDLSKVVIGEEGMVQTGAHSFVNPDALSESGFAAAVSFKNTPPPIVSSSAPVVTEERDTKEAVTIAAATLPEAPVAPDTTAVTSAFEAGQKLLADFMKQLETRRAAEVASIKTGFDIEGKKQEKAQIREKGSTAVGLARAGGFLGFTGSGTGVMLNLAETHRSEVTALEAKRQDAIRKANSAVADKQFQLARSMVKDAKDFEQQIFQRNQAFFNRQLQFQQETRTQDKALQERFKRNIETFAITDIIDPDKAAEIDDYFGFEGYTVERVKIAQDETAAKSEKSRIALLQAKKNLLKASSPNPGDEPMSPLDAQRIKDLYGFLPPLGATMNQITQYSLDNVGKTPKELQEGIDLIFRGGDDPLAFSGEEFIDRDVIDRDFPGKKDKELDKIMKFVATSRITINPDTGALYTDVEIYNAIKEGVI